MLTHWSYIFLALTHRYSRKIHWLSVVVRKQTFLLARWPCKITLVCTLSYCPVSSCYKTVHYNIILHADGSVQHCSISSALAMEILQSCTRPSIWYNNYKSITQTILWTQMKLCYVGMAWASYQIHKIVGCARWECCMYVFARTFSPWPTSKETAS